MTKETTGACTGNQCKELNPNVHSCSRDILDIIKKETENNMPENYGVDKDNNE